MVYAVGLPVEGPGQAADLVLAGLGAAAESYDTAPPKGVSSSKGSHPRRGPGHVCSCGHITWLPVGSRAHTKLA